MKREVAPLIVHVVYALDTGGLENGLINLINRIPVNSFRHAIIAYTKITEFSKRIQRPDVELIALNHLPGHQTLKLLPRLVKEFRRLKPNIVHTRNLATLDAQVAAKVATNAARVHGEHGWDVGDLDGSNVTNLRYRKVFRFFTQRQIALSKDTQNYLVNRVRVPVDKTVRICNGVDTDVFHPHVAAPEDFERHCSPDDFIFGTVGRCSGVKNQSLLIRAFANLIDSGVSKIKLIIVGDGPQLEDHRKLSEQLGCEKAIWFAGARKDIPSLLAQFDCFVLPSLSEGISNSILESLACGVPVIASNVGGNAELVSAEVGDLFESKNLNALTTQMTDYYRKRFLLEPKQTAARARAVNQFSIEQMMQSYVSVYNSVLKKLE